MNRRSRHLLSPKILSPRRLPCALHQVLRRRPGQWPAWFVMGGLMGLSGPVAAVGPFPAKFELSNLLAVNGGDGTSGFALYGAEEFDAAGRSVAAAGDVNDDGLADIIIGAGGSGEAGRAFVIFGKKQSFPAEFELGWLLPDNGGDGSIGFVVDGIDPGDTTGYSVSSAADVNGDGIDDLIIGAYAADPTGFGSGRSYVVFGKKSGFPAVFELASLLPANGGDGTAGFVLNGVGSDDRSGFSVSGAGDVNGDGFDDVIIGASHADVAGEPAVGRAFVVFGSKQPAAPELWLGALLPANGGDGSMGFVLNGIYTGALAGSSVSGAGDVNGDGFDDVIVGAYAADPDGQKNAGQAYVVFGTGEPLPPVIPLASLLPENGGDGSVGVVFDGVAADDDAGFSVSGAGDVNADGVADLIVGAFDAAGFQPGAGASYVVFGTNAGFPAEFELASLLAVNGGDGSAGFVLEGINFDDLAGISVSGAGDVNADGADDVIIGARRADPGGRDRAGESYVVFGSASGFPAEVPLVSLLPAFGGDGSTGFVLNGIDPEDYSGTSVSAAGDVNGDGIDDIIIGSREADPGGRNLAGESYVVFGRRDSDGDGLADNADNCTLVPNPGQRDTDGDGFGSLCDADLNNSCFVNVVDFLIFRSRLGGSDQDADFNGDGIVNFQDFRIMRPQFGSPPGPSGVPNICE